MSDQEIIETLQSILRNILDCDDIVLTEKTKFADFGISSFGLVQLICAVEDTFDIEIPNAAIKSINSIPSAVRYIKKELKSKS